MDNINKIAEGFYNNLTNRKEELFKNRIEICRSCKLHKVDRIFGEVCNSTLYINPITNETSKTAKIGFIHGCGCVLKSKCRVESAHCPIGR